MTFQSSIMEKMNTLLDETIHITFECIVHLIATIKIKWCPS